MSVTGHRDVRHPDDFYETPAWCVSALLPYLQRGPVLDPCCGTGAVAKAIRAAWGPLAWIEGVEINEGRYAEAAQSGHFSSDAAGARVGFGDWLSSIEPEQKIPLIVTNPPFKLALEFADQAIKRADTVAFLLRLNWLASETRRKFHEAHPADLVIMPRRPSFAQFASCGGGMVQLGAGPTLAQARKPRCDWKATFPVSEQVPKVCPYCGGRVKVSTTDSTEYAWFIWGPGRGNRYEIAGNRHPIDWAQVKRDLEVGAAAIDAAAEGA